MSYSNDNQWFEQWKDGWVTKEFFNIIKKKREEEIAKLVNEKKDLQSIGILQGRIQMLEELRSLSKTEFEWYLETFGEKQ